MTTTSLSPRVDAARIAASITRFATMTDEGEGVTRLAYGQLERDAHDVFRSAMTELGLIVTTDAVGNTIAELDATTEDSDGERAGGARLPGVGSGSHLDSVPHGGRFDGVVGVAAAMEVARVVVEQGIAHRRPWIFVVFAAEEGARFGQACNGSRVIAGLAGTDDIRGLRDASGRTMFDAMTELGLDPGAASSAHWDAADWHAFVELHIEQGSVLESRGIPVGIVDAISGSTRLAVSITGQASHTGGTPMHLRRDALVTASRCVLEGERIAVDPEHHGTRVTVGRMNVLPGSITTIPGRVEFTVDVRDVDSARQRRTAETLVATYRSIGADCGTGVEIELIGDTSPVVLPAWVTARIVSAAKELGLHYRVMPSGASHDTQQIDRIVPAGMIFVPSRQGLSHVPEEHTEAADIATGAELLLATLLELDAS